MPINMRFNNRHYTLVNYAKIEIVKRWYKMETILVLVMSNSTTAKTLSPSQVDGAIIGTLFCGGIGAALGAVYSVVSRDECETLGCSRKRRCLTCRKQRRRTWRYAFYGVGAGTATGLGITYGVHHSR
jgi:hypothetical protein